MEKVAIRVVLEFDNYLPVLPKGLRGSTCVLTHSLLWAILCLPFARYPVCVNGLWRESPCIEETQRSCIELWGETMVEIEEMTAEEMRALLKGAAYGHLGCARDNRPYVIPLNYAYEEPEIYFLTTVGMKTEFISVNPEVCLQVEYVEDSMHWRSVIATGQAELLSEHEDIEHAMQLITMRNPTLTPALSRVWIDSLGRANNTAIYRIHPHILSGRKTV
jgi:nitroimidazol reductase NimA-like FMN-containing flavoprotein (pyridoxamine 5'-phosphate oxidase superfamily)